MHHFSETYDGTPARTWTVDILIKSEALYQLSYGRKQASFEKVRGI